MYVFSKFVEFFLVPGNVLVLLLVAGVALEWTRWPALGRRITTVAAALFLIFWLVPVGFLIVKPLEDTYSRPPLPRHVDGILVLGGVFSPPIYLARGAPSQNVVEGRFVAAADLSRRYPEARIVFSGGSGAVFGDQTPEARVARLAFAELGVDQSRITLEGRSRNTWENILYSRDLVKPKPGETWILATSAFQLPRAMAIARRLHWKFIPWPTDYMTSTSLNPFPLQLDLSNNLNAADIGIHEWLGIVCYRLMGRAA